MNLWERHGLTNTRIHQIWGRTKSRCNNPKDPSFKNFGGKGIVFCTEWSEDFTKFYEWAIATGYEEHLHLKRKDMNGNFKPSNCFFGQKADRCTKAKPKSKIVAKKTRNNSTAIKYSGNKKHKLYTTWRGIKDRCFCVTNKDYRYYGEKGITVCDEWKDSYETFYHWAMANGFKEELTLCRKDRRGNYSPENCKWATWKEQQRTRTNTVKVTIGEETRTISEWAEITGLNFGTIRSRMERGITGENLIAPKGKLLLGDNVTTFRQVAEESGINYGTLVNRYFRGVRGKELIKEPRKREKSNQKITVNGKSMTLKQWSEAMNIEYCTLHTRYKKGLRGQDLIKAPQNSKRRKKNNSHT